MEWINELPALRLRGGATSRHRIEGGQFGCLYPLLAKFYSVKSSDWETLFFSLIKLIWNVLQVWRVADAPEDDKYQYTYFTHKLNSFDTAPKKLLPSDSRLRPDRYALEKGDLSKAGSEKSRSLSLSLTRTHAPVHTHTQTHTHTLNLSS